MNTPQIYGPEWVARIMNRVQNLPRISKKDRVDEINVLFHSIVQMYHFGEKGEATIFIVSFFLDRLNLSLIELSDEYYVAYETASPALTKEDFVKDKITVLESLIESFNEIEVFIITEESKIRTKRLEQTDSIFHLQSLVSNYKSQSVQDKGSWLSHFQKDDDHIDLLIKLAFEIANSGEYNFNRSVGNGFVHLLDAEGRLNYNFAPKYSTLNGYTGAPLSIIEKVLFHSPGNLFANILKANILYSLHDEREQAIDILQLQLTKFPTNPILHIDLSFFYMLNSDLKEAFAHLDLALSNLNGVHFPYVYNKAMEVLRQEESYFSREDFESRIRAIMLEAYAIDNSITAQIKLDYEVCCNKDKLFSQLIQLENCLKFKPFRNDIIIRALQFENRLYSSSFRKEDVVKILEGLDLNTVKRMQEEFFEEKNNFEYPHIGQQRFESLSVSEYGENSYIVRFDQTDFKVLKSNFYIQNLFMRYQYYANKYNNLEMSGGIYVVRNLKSDPIITIILDLVT